MRELMPARILVIGDDAHLEQLLTHAMNGEVLLEEREAGACFTLRLPVADGK